jgi:uncharacterized protein with HEPN domain
LSDRVARGVRARLADIAEEIAVLKRYASGVAYEDFVQAPGLRRIVQASVLVISEAARHLPPHITDQVPNVPWSRIRAIGNIIRHEYFRIDPDILWGIVEENLTQLDDAVTKLSAIAVTDDE